MAALLYFARGQWTFENYRMQSLWKNLNETDKELFYFNLAICDWKDILWTHANGMKMHILKEKSTPENAKKAKTKLKMFVTFFCFTNVHNFQVYIKDFFYLSGCL